MANPYRGEVTLTINGQERRLRLSLGALAELEAGLGASSLTGLVERFETGDFTTTDIIALLAAGLTDLGEDDLRVAEIDGGPVAAARAAAQLLKLTFALPEVTE